MAAKMHSNTITLFLKQFWSLQKIASHIVLPSIFKLEENFRSAELRRYKSKISDEVSLDVKSHELKETKDLNDFEQSKKKEATTHQEALVDKLHPNDRPMSKAVPIRSKTEGIDDILARWNVIKPKKK